MSNARPEVEIPTSSRLDRPPSPASQRGPMPEPKRETPDTECPHCHRQFNGKRGVASHQYRCSAKTAAASPVTAAPPPQPPPLQAHVCPKCNFGASKAQGLSQHMRVCCKDLRDASRKPKYSAANYKATPLLEGAQRETIEHVLFECTALSDIRTSSLTTSDRSQGQGILCPSDGHIPPRGSREAQGLLPTSPSHPSASNSNCKRRKISR